MLLRIRNPHGKELFDSKKHYNISKTMWFQLLGNNEYPSQRLFELFMLPNVRFMYLNRLRELYRPWNWNVEQNYNQFWTTIKTMKDKFQINLDVQHFAPDEISVKTVDGYIIIEGQHEEKQDEHGYVSRHFTRRYSLPERYNPDLVESKLSSDGVLTVTAQKFSPESKNVRAIPIVLTGPIRKEMIDETPQITSNASEK